MIYLWHTYSLAKNNKQQTQKNTQKGTYAKSTQKQKKKHTEEKTPADAQNKLSHTCNKSVADLVQLLIILEVLLKVKAALIASVDHLLQNTLAVGRQMLTVQTYRCIQHTHFMYYQHNTHVYVRQVPTSVGILGETQI